MAWYLCCTSPTEPRNWSLCKEYGLFGYTRGMPRCVPGDHLIFWKGQKGYVAYGLVTGSPRVPWGRVDAPWPGGTLRFTAVVPMKVLVEVDIPIFYGFKENLQDRTGLNKGHLQRGMCRIDDQVATDLAAQLLERYLKQPVEAS